MHSYIDESIDFFKQRIKEEPEFCRQLFDYATVRLLALKYAYYILNQELVKDVSYDFSEKDWYVMGRALGVLKEDDISPCVDFDYSHPMAEEGIRLANKLLRS
jgi:hypothetical protein